MPGTNLVNATPSLSRRIARSQAGLTLLELMIVVVIIGILAAWAIPSYREYTTRSHRAAAQAFLQDIANRQAQYMLDTRSYATSVAALALTTPADVAGRYNVAISASSGPPPSWTATATPIGDQANERCGTLSIDNTGAKAATGTAPSGCW
jgi:type IV pilus assembly protein PilE